MNKYWPAAGGLIAGVFILAALQQQQEPTGAITPALTAEPEATGVPVPEINPTLTAVNKPAASQPLRDLDDAELDAWLPRLDSDAIASMSAARINGDERTPPLSAPAARVMPTTAELADEELYQKYETRQNKRVYRAFVEASQQKVAVIQSYIDQAEAGGISKEEVAFAEGKIRRIKAMAEQLQQDNPDLMSEEYQPQESWLPAAD